MIHNMLTVTAKNLCQGKYRLPIRNRLPGLACCIYKSENNLSTSPENSRVNQLKKYWVFRYSECIKHYEKVIEKNFPKTMQVYRIFCVGTQKFYNDMKLYILVRKKINHYGVDHLSREELQLSFNFPRDFVKITPVLLISAIPFTNYIIFPLALYFPGLILTSHYWSVQDKFNFIIKNHKKKLQHSKLLLRNVQWKVNKVKDQITQIKLKVVIAHLGSGTHPSITDVLYCKKLFSGFPYSLKYIEREHCKELLQIHGMSTLRLRNRNRLKERGLFIKKMDLAIQREGGVKTLSYEDLRWALSFRGINPVNISIDRMQAWLECWLLISSEIDSDSISLLLHCPILLAYNQEANWILLYYNKKKY